MTAEKVSLTREKETLLITLYAKAGESRLPDSLLRDRFAAEAVSRIDYDFSRLMIDRDLMIGVAMRAHILDGWTRDFIGRHREATVLHLGCGLDSRIFRVDPASNIRWFDLDYPEVIALRRKLYPRRDGYSLIGSSVTDPNWVADVPVDRPTIIVAEGLFPYLPADEVTKLLRRLTAHLQCGELVFDGYSRLGLALISWQPSVRVTGARLRWAINDPRELETEVPRLKLLTEVPAYDPEAYDPRQIARLSWAARLAIYAFAAAPVLGRIGWLLRFRF
ncbi:class I SAM-dependent methyltransferase [Pararhizobium sp. LjRoot255]|uniref:class I SAM-dependent methyltransferase n=1 Tax=Pararhizobium sp. LjRoot255 TaxID=3342298 RepID=UPI003ECF34CF